MARKKIKLKDPKGAWQKAKANILKHLEEGWSIQVAFHKERAWQYTELYAEYRKDMEFRAIVDIYRQKTRGFYTGIIENDSKI